MNSKSFDQQRIAVEAARKAMIARSSYREGDVIGRRYQVHKVLGRGGFGLVYLVSSVEDGSIYAVKTFLDEYIFDEGVKQSFEKEALIWVRLGWNPFIVQAHHVQFLDGRTLVAMDYIPADENGLVSVYDHIAYHGTRLGDRKIGTWTVQFCHGMEHAQSRGVKAHRDIKPMNLLVGDGPLLKISDFGLVASLVASTKPLMGQQHAGAGLTILHTDGKAVGGTPGYISPEILRTEGAGVHSDIFAFGITLWQLAAGTTDFPYSVRYRGDREQFTRELYEQQMRARVAPLQSIFWPIIRKCLDPDPARRFASYEELRSATKATMKASDIVPMDFIVNKDRKSVPEIINRGASLRALGRLDDAIRCYDEALSLDPANALALVNKGNALSEMRRREQAMASYDAALKADPGCEAAWYNRAVYLQRDEQHERAIRSFDALLKLNPRNALAFARKGDSCIECGQVEQALQCFKTAVEIRPLDAGLWTSRGEGFSRCGRVEEALQCYDEAIELDLSYIPAWIDKARQLVIAGRAREGMECFSALVSIYSGDPAALNQVGVALCSVNRYAESIPLFEQALKLRPGEAAVMLCNKGNALLEMDRQEEALKCYAESLAANSKYIHACIQGAKAHHQLGNLKDTVDWYARALKIDPRDEESWFGRGSALLELGEHEPAIRCFDNALVARPTNTKVLYNKGVALLSLDNPDAALDCLGKAVQIEPGYGRAWYVKAHIEKALGGRAAAIASCQAFLKIADQSNVQERKNVLAWLVELGAMP